MIINNKEYEKVGLPNWISYEDHILKIGYEGILQNTNDCGLVIPGLLSITNREKEKEDWGTSGDLVLLNEESKYYITKKNGDHSL